MKKFTTKTRLARAAMTLLVASLTTATAWAQTLSGDGTTYVINNAADWATFAADVNGGYSYEGKTVKLSDTFDNSSEAVTDMVGTSTNMFKGTFNGNNKTLKVNLSATTEYCAPFRYVNGATITSLHTTGTVVAESHASNDKYRSGLIGQTNGNVTIQDCWSSVAITSEINGDGTHSGLIAITNSGTVNITNCVFDGSITGSNTTNCGGFVGWRNGATLNITNCLMAGTFDIKVDSNSATFNRNGGSTISNSYYITALGAAQGIQAFTAASANEIYKQLTFADGNNYYAHCTITGINVSYPYTGSTITITPTVKDADGTTLTVGTHYTVAFTKDDSTVSEVKETGTYTITITGNASNSYVGEKNFTFEVIEVPSGHGTATEPYVINSADDWATFANSVNKGITYEGQYVKLSDTFDNSSNAVSVMVGTVAKEGNSTVLVNPFKGTFDGNGKTLYVNIPDDDNQGVAPFRYISGATIKNLTVTGSVAGTKEHAAGLVGFSKGTGNQILDCKVSVNVNGSTHVGGILGHGLDSDIAIERCVYSGLITGGSSAKGVIFGWGDNGGTKSITDCLYLFLTGQNTSNLDLVKKNGGTVTVTRCYKTTNAGSEGTQVYASAPEGEISKQLTLADGNNYYALCTITGIDASYPYTGSTITVTPTVKDADGTTLTVGTHYTVALTKDGSTVSEVKEPGTYTITITAKSGSGYDGSSTKDFTVVVPKPTALTATIETNTSAILSWTAPGGTVTGYTYQYKKNGEETWSTEATVTGTSVTLTGLTPATNYDFRVRIISGSYESEYAEATFYFGYCVPSLVNSSDCITNITLGDINNTTASNSTNGYGDYTNLSTDLEQGASATLSLTSGSGSGSHGAAVWIDFNDNLTFESSERVGTYNSITASSTVSIDLTIPVDAADGSHRMRVKYQYNVEGTNVDPCTSPNKFGEAEDYTVNITVASTEPSIKLTPATAEIFIGFTQTLTATTRNVTDTPTITYTSSNTSVATVSGSGTTATVTGVSAGTAIITATMTYEGTDYTATCTVTVNNSEGFETGLGNWTVTADNSSYKWERKAGTGHSSYTSAGEGNYNVGAYYSSGRLNTYTYLTLNTDLSSFTDKKISFMYINPAWSSDIDNIYLQYSTDGTNYTDLASYTEGAGSWTQVNSLSIPDEAKYIRFAAYSNYGYGAGLDEISLEYASCRKPTGLALSGITTSGVTATWDAEEGDVFDYALVQGTGIDPATVTYEGSATATSTTCSMSWNNLLADTDYTVFIRRNCGNDEYSNAVAQSFTTEATYPRPTNVTASNLTHNSATISWDSDAESYNVKYATATVTGTTLEPVFEDGFESGLTGWTTYARDYDDATYNWQQYNGNSVDEGNHTGDYVAASRSWHSSNGDQSVDNWLVSPQMILGNTLKFWVATNGGFPDSYAVYVSTGSGVVPSSGTGDFTVVANLTPATGSWTEQTYDLSAYAGKQGYVAIRHKDSAKDHLLVDDFGVYNTVNTYSYGTKHTLTTNETSCSLTGLTAETLYEVQVQADYGSEGTSGWSKAYFTTPDACTAPTSLVASDITTNSATLSWANTQESYNLRYREVYFYESFEDETMPTGWTTIDANNDGHCWQIGSGKSHSGANGAYDISFIYQTSNISPDDYLVSPLLDLQGTLRVWLTGNETDKYAETFAIYLSTTGNTASDFTTTLIGETTTTNSYVEYTADLSSYTGQKGYIAIRHFNCTDQREIYVDDFGLYGSEDWVTVNNVDDATHTLTGLQSNTLYEWQVQGLNCNSAGSETEWSEVAKFTTMPEAVDITLADNATDNATTIEGNHGVYANVKLNGRKLYKDNSWNTLCLPFGIANINAEGNPLNGAIVRELRNASISGTTLTLYFKNATTAIKAGTPYIVKWEVESNSTIEDPVFNGVSIDKTVHNYDNGENGDARVRFLGTYDAITFSDIEGFTEDKSILFMGEENTLYYPQVGVDEQSGDNVYPFIGACRAYFKIGEDGAGARQLTGFVLNFGDGEAQGIESLTTVGASPVPARDGSIYTLNGVKVEKPTRKGLYIQNGKKIVVH